jgi:hypoxanthine-DNA glycosylase
MAESESPACGFPPVSRGDALVLILGSLPGQRSIRDAEYYAHPQNAFWRIMADVLGIAGSYDERCRALVDHRIALWDVLAESVRPGSLDADIKTPTAIANDFSRFLEVHGQVHRICFNGRKAAALFEKFAAPQRLSAGLEFASLPSTSPAYAAMPYDQKLEIWAEALSPAPGTGNV